MKQNVSTAVMQRRGKPPNELDYFPTPPFATRALCEWLREVADQQLVSCWEPACGEKHMVRPLQEYFCHVKATDVHQYGENEIIDFPLMAKYSPDADYDFIISNPPFLLAQQFIETALDIAHVGVCMLLRSAFLEGQERFEDLFSKIPPTHVLQFSERVLMLRDRLVRYLDVDPVSGKTASTATAYCWFVWIKGDMGAVTQLHWIPPQRRKLERPGDYPDYAETDFEPGPLFQ